MSEVYFTSDSHFHHKKIIEFCRDTRKGDDVEEMNDLMIDAWNKRVRPHDRIYHLGDFSFGSVSATRDILNRLNGNITLILGNHDSSKMLSQLNYHFVEICDYKVHRFGDHRIVMMHFPIENWDSMHHGTLHLHGHLHGDSHHSCRIMKNRIDVGVDCREEKDMAPFSLSEVIDRIKRQNESIV